MRRLLTVFLVMTSTPAFAGGEDAAILKVHDDLAASWNKHDYKAMSALFADDADLINPLGRVAKGRAEIEQLYKDEQTGSFKASHFVSDCKGNVHMVTRDVAVVTCSFEVTDGSLPDGKVMPPLKGLYTATMRKTKKQWRIVAGRPMIPFTPPTATNK